MIINRIYSNNILKGRNVKIKDKTYIINFGFNNSYDLFLNGSFIANKSNYKEMIKYLKGIK